MELFIVFGLLAVGITLNEFRPRRHEETAETLISMERAALERWGKGDPSGFLEICDSDVVYFDPFLDKRLDGLEELRKLYESLRGQIRIDSYDLLNPKVQAGSDMAVLTFNLVSHMAEGDKRWNCTEVYRHRGGQWRIIQTHWSLTAAATP